MRGENGSSLRVAAYYSRNIQLLHQLVIRLSTNHHETSRPTRLLSKLLKEGLLFYSYVNVLPWCRVIVLKFLF